MKRLVLPLLVAAVLACGATTAWAETPPVPGDDVVLDADAQPGYQGQRTCSPAPKPGTVALLDLLIQRWGGSSWGISRGCDVGNRSEHKEGRALDWHMDIANPADRMRVADALGWLTANNGEVAGRLGVMYIIWDQKVWASYRQSEGWRPMADRGSYTANHSDHVHISLTWDGAMQQTSWWTGVPVTEPLSGPCGVDGAPPCKPLTAGAMQAMLLASPDEVFLPDSLPAPAEIPLIGGTPKVGHLLEVVPGTWVPGGSTLVFQWIMDSTPIPGANDLTYIVTRLDAGTALRVRVIAFVPDGSVIIKLSDELPAVAPAEFRGVAVPTLIGEPLVGRLLSVDPGIWRPFPATMSFQWYADGRPIPGATGYSHQLTGSDIGRRISVTVTGSATGFARTTATSAQSAPVRRAELTSPTPIVTGDLIQGQTLTAVAGDWSPAPVELSYRWLRDGKPIKAATRATYKLTEADVGAVIQVRVRGSKPGHSATTVLSVAGRAVQPAPEPAPETTPTTPSATPTAAPSSPAASPTPTSTPAPAPDPSPTPEAVPSSTPTPSPEPEPSSTPPGESP